MKIYSNTKNVEIKEYSKINTGEYNTELLNVELSDEFQGLNNFVVYEIKGLSDTKFSKSAILNNTAYFPEFEISQEIGIGVYGFELNGEDLILRYSPTPAFFKVENGTYKDGIDNIEPETPTDFERYVNEIKLLISGKQDKLIAGDGITIDENNIISSTGGGGGGTTDYNKLSNKPKINDVELLGNKSLTDLSIANNTQTAHIDLGGDTPYEETKTMPEWIDTLYFQDYELMRETNLLQNEITDLKSLKQDVLTAGKNIIIEDNVISATSGGSGGTDDYTDLTDKPQINGIELIGNKNSEDLSIPTSEDLDLKQDKEITIGEETLTITQAFNNLVELLPTLMDKQDRVNDVELDSTATSVILTDNTEFTIQTLPDNFEIIWNVAQTSFVCSLSLKTGTTAPTLTYPSGIKWSGDDVTSNVFVPLANMQYDICFYYNSITQNAIVRGVAV